MTVAWWAAFGPAEATARCGDQQHRLRWEAGRLTAHDHPDAEGELVLGTLGGDQPYCIRLLRAWGEHSDDLDVLMLGPRSAADTLTVDVRDAERLQAGPRGWTGYAPLSAGRRPRMPLTWGTLWSSTRRSFVVNARGMPRGRATYWAGSSAPGGRVAGRHAVTRSASVSQIQSSPRGALLRGTLPDLDRELARRAEVLELLALGPAFQFRLCATVAATWSQRDSGTARPALTAALTGRLAPVIASWLGTDADQVRVRLDEGGGGLAQDGDQWRAGMPWVAAVWGAGLAVIDGRLVTDVARAGYPKADVLAIEEPGGEPAALAVRCESAAGSPHEPRWRIIRS